MDIWYVANPPPPPGPGGAGRVCVGGGGAALSPFMFTLVSYSYIIASLIQFIYCQCRFGCYAALCRHKVDCDASPTFMRLVGW